MKIIQVLNAMITNKQKINSVIQNDKEYFFIYDNKHKWSISQTKDEEYYVHFYPSNKLTLDQLSQMTDWTEFSEFVTYSTKDLKTIEAEETFSELYNVVSDKLFGIDDIFDEIIKGG